MVLKRDWNWAKGDLCLWRMKVEQMDSEKVVMDKMVVDIQGWREETDKLVLDRKEVDMTGLSKE